MVKSGDKQILGLSRRARRFVLPILAVAVAVILVGQFTVFKGVGGDGSGPRVGDDLHALTELGSALYVGGHGGASRRVEDGEWTQIDSLDDKDVMGWAITGDQILAGGHQGLYVSTDEGSSFTPAPDFAGVDVHALGASGAVVYLASPAGGVLVSTDAAENFEMRSDVGTAFMGSIWVDPDDPDVAIAPSMQSGAMKTTDGGQTWSALGSPMGAMSVAADGSGRNLVVMGMGEAAQSDDGGATWASLDVPAGTSAATYTAEGDLLAAVLSDERASVFRSAAGRWEPLK